jgi:hypothetical protein
VDAMSVMPTPMSQLLHASVVLSTGTATVHVPSISALT